MAVAKMMTHAGSYTSRAAPAEVYGCYLKPLPDRVTARMCRYPSVAAIHFLTCTVVACAYTPESNQVRDATAAQTGIDGATTASASQIAHGYKGLKRGVWRNQFVKDDTQLQALADAVAELNLEPRRVRQLKSKCNPKFEPHDIIRVRHFTGYDSDSEVVRVKHTWGLRPGGGGAETELTVREWTA